MGERIQVGLLYGGETGKEQSQQSAQAVISALDGGKYEVLPIYIEDNRELPAVLEHVRQSGRIPDVMLPLLRGASEHKGSIQALLELTGIPYAGAGVLASAAGMDRVVQKKMLAQEGLPQCAFRHFNRRQWEKDPHFFIMEIEVALGYPCFIKPADFGAGRGTVMAVTREELKNGIDDAFRFGRKVVVEEYVEAGQLVVGILGNDEPKASEPFELVITEESAASIKPAAEWLQEETSEVLRVMAKRAFASIDGSGLALVHFGMRRLDGELFIHEMDMTPGLMPTDLYPLLWKASGMTHRDLLDRVLMLALELHSHKRQSGRGIA